MPFRRSYLASTASLLAAVAGCTESALAPETDTKRSTRRTTTRSTTSEDPLTEPQQLPWGDTATVDGVSVTPRTVGVQQSAFYLTTPDSMDVLSFGDRQAVFVTLAVDGDTLPEPGEFALSAGETVGGWVDYGGVRGTRFYEQGTPYTAGEEGDGWVGFAVPDAITDSDPRLRLQFGGEFDGAVRWPVPDGTAAALRSPPPEFAVTEFEAPDTVSADEPVTVSATVENRGEGRGTFRAAFNELGPVYAPNTVELDVGPGESRTWEGVADSHVGNGNAAVVRFDFRSPAASYEREVEITDA